MLRCGLRWTALLWMFASMVLVHPQPSDSSLRWNRTHWRPSADLAEAEEPEVFRSEERAVCGARIVISMKVNCFALWCVSIHLPLKVPSASPAWSSEFEEHLLRKRDKAVRLLSCLIELFPSGFARIFCFLKKKKPQTNVAVN